MTLILRRLTATADFGAVAAIAKEIRFMISADDLKKAQSALSDEELGNASGGTRYPKLKPTVLSFIGNLC
ncbi:Nif11-like leader peptide family RiPP precursor [Synechococcus sp. MIT S9504]|uniref:Nif11-like leader peptide family RiPP precursor n=1 Tax=Synechococcus sp. MIT S9504 TaxID=1801628 RepID=UPI000AADD5C5